MSHIDTQSLPRPLTLIVGSRGLLEDVPFVVELRDGGPGVDGQAGMSIVAFLVGV